MFAALVFTALAALGFYFAFVGAARVCTPTCHPLIRVGEVPFTVMGVMFLFVCSTAIAAKGSTAVSWGWGSLAFQTSMSYTGGGSYGDGSTYVLHPWAPLYALIPVVLGVIAAFVVASHRREEHAHRPTS